MDEVVPGSVTVIMYILFSISLGIAVKDPSNYSPFGCSCLGLHEQLYCTYLARKFCMYISQVLLAGLWDISNPLGFGDTGTPHSGFVYCKNR